MLEVLFQKIPQFLFEPIAVTAFLGLIVALICNWKKRDKFYYIILLALLFIIGWRCVVKIIAARYASILIIPATIAISWLFFKIGDWLKKIPQIPFRVAHCFPWLLLLIFVGICGAKIARFNPYDDYIINCSQELKSDLAQYPTYGVFSDDKDHLRYQYYSGVPIIAQPLFNDFADNRNLPLIRSLINQKKGHCEAIYFILEEPRKRAVITAAELNVPGDWQLLKQYFQNRKKRKQLRLYRWTVKAHQASNN